MCQRADMLDRLPGGFFVAGLTARADVDDRHAELARQAEDRLKPGTVGRRRLHRRHFEAMLGQEAPYLGYLAGAGIRAYVLAHASDGGQLDILVAGPGNMLK